MAKTSTSKLTDKQKTFVEEYLVDLNATQAAIRAGYSERSAHNIASRLLKRDDIKDAIREAMHERSERTKVTADRVILEISRVAFANMSDYAAWAGNTLVIKDSATLSEDAIAGIAEVTEHRSEMGSTIKFKLHDKIKALEMLCKHLGLYDDGAHVTVNQNIQEQHTNIDVSQLSDEELQDFEQLVKRMKQRA